MQQICWSPCTSSTKFHQNRLRFIEDIAKTCCSLFLFRTQSRYICSSRAWHFRGLLFCNAALSINDTTTTTNRAAEVLAVNDAFDEESYRQASGVCNIMNTWSLSVFLTCGACRRIAWKRTTTHAALWFSTTITTTQRYLHYHRL